MADVAGASGEAERAALEAHGEAALEAHGEAHGEAAGALSAAARARMERNQRRARALRAARLPAPAARPAQGRAPDSGGGFLPEEPHEPRRAAPRPAPVVHVADQPHCLECERPFPQSFLFDTFAFSVCDECRDAEGAHALLTRTEAKSAYLLQDCDLDARPPPLPAARRRNPHRGGADMRLYLRAQVEARALQVWGGAAALQGERERRAGRRERARREAGARRLRALRLDVRSSLFARAAPAHAHRWGAERHDAAADEYSRLCLDCGHEETYEKM